MVESLADVENLASMWRDPEMHAWLASGGIEKAILQSRRDSRARKITRRVFKNADVVVAEVPNGPL